MLLKAAVEEFLRYCSIERQLSPHTLQAYTIDLSDFSCFLPVGIVVSSLSEKNLAEYLTDLLDRRKLALATVRRRFACLRAFIRRLVLAGEVQDLFAKWRLQLPRRKRLPRALSRSEVSLLLAGFSSQRGPS